VWRRCSATPRFAAHPRATADRARQVRPRRAATIELA
jgi:hypothetical protein